MDVYEIITNRIVESLEKGTVPWQCPWTKGKYGIPRNFVSTKAYRGINVFLLSYTAQMKGYQSPFWVSYKQAQSLGGNVKAGEKSSSPVVFYSEIEKKSRRDELNEEGEKETYAMLRYTPMWNTDQCDGLNVPVLSDGPVYEHEIIASAQAIVENMPNRPKLNIQQSNRAFYSIQNDSVTAPLLNQYPQAEQFYSTLFHELGHSTGAKHRLGREFGSTFGDHLYSKEELVAEFTASYLCGIAGIEKRTIENSAGYIDGWLTILKDKHQKKWVTWAAGQAQKAADYIQGVNLETAVQAKLAA
jgi:antirestriction protein ArdC